MIVTTSVAVLLNACAMMYIFKRRKKLKSIDILLSLIFFINIIYGSASISNEIIFHMDFMIMTDEKLNQLEILVYINNIVTIFSFHLQCSIVLLLAVQRFIAINYPIESLKYISKNNTWKQVIIVFLLTVTLFIPLVYLFIDDSSNALLNNHIIFSSILIQGCLTIFLYVQLILKLFLRKYKSKNFTTSVSKSKFKAIVLSVVISLSFVISYFPLSIHMLSYPEPQSAVYTLLTIIDSITNPLMYFITNASACLFFRKKLRKITPFIHSTYNSKIHSLNISRSNSMQISVISRSNSIQLSITSQEQEQNKL